MKLADDLVVGSQREKAMAAPYSFNISLSCKKEDSDAIAPLSPSDGAVMRFDLCWLGCFTRVSY